MREVALRRRSLLRFAAGGGLCLAAPASAALARPHSAIGDLIRRLWRPVVMLDPGHGGKDPGAISPDGVFEKNINLATARDLAGLLRKTHRYRVLMTRYGDEFVPLEQRVALARAAHADVFLSIHADALADTALRGASVYTLSAHATDQESAALAKSENQGQRVDGVDLAQQPKFVGNILFDLAQRQTDNLSILLGHDLVDALRRRALMLERPLRAADFVVLTAPDIPSALVELGCLSNPLEEHLLQQPSYRWRLARALAGAVEDYLAVHPEV